MCPPRRSPLKPALVHASIALTCLSVFITGVASAGDDLSDQYTFKQLKIGGGGYVTGLAIHPDPDGPMYCRTDVGGMYRRDGDRWTQLLTLEALPPEALTQTSEEQPMAVGAAKAHAYHVEAIAIDPSDPDVLFVAAGRFQNLPGLILRSEDRGESFSLSQFDQFVMMAGNAEHRFRNERLAVQPGGTGVVLFGSRNDGLFRSTDGGRTFSKVEGIPEGKSGRELIGVGPIKFDPAQPNVAWLSAEGAGVFRSEDGGATWSHSFYPVVKDLEIAGDIVYAVEQGGSMHKFADGAWSEITPPHGNRMNDLAVHPDNPGVVYAADNGTQRFVRSNDGGATWTTLRASSTGDQGRAMFQSPDIPWVESSDVRHWLSVGDLRFDPRDPDRLWFAEGMGTWVSTPLSQADPKVGPAFINVSQGIEETVATDVYAAPGGKVTVTVMDRAGFHYEGHDALDEYPRQQIGLTEQFTMGSRLHAMGTDPMFIVATLSDTRMPSGIAGGYGYDGDGNHSGYSTDGGKTWTVFESIDPQTEFNTPRTLRFGEIVVSATDPDNMVWLPRIGGADTNIYYTADRGQTWQPGRGLDTHEDFRSHYHYTKHSLAADAVMPGRFYAYSWKEGLLYRSDDGGRSWAVPDGAAGLPKWMYHNRFLAIPGKAEHLWLATGFDYRGPEDQRGLYHTTDGGMNWQKIPGVDNAWAIGLGKAQQPSGPLTLFMYGQIDGDFGLYRSTDNGSSFDLISPAPLGIVDQITTVAGDPDVFGKVYVGFTGNGFAFGVHKP